MMPQSLKTSKNFVLQNCEARDSSYLSASYVKLGL